MSIDTLTSAERYMLGHVRPEAELDIGPAPDDLLSWLKDSAIPLHSAEPFADDDDLLPLLSMIGDARVVGLGEATHGTSEFFALKHRLFRFLVEELGFTTLGVEAGFAESLVIGAYVRGGPAPSFAGQHPELVALVDWMRDRNLSGRHPQLRFFGFDMQSATRAISESLAAARRIDPAAAERIAWDLAPLGSSFGASHYRAAPASARQRVQGGLAELWELLDAHRAADGEDGELATAALLVRSAQWAERYAYFPTQRGRDEAMASMVLDTLDRDGPRSKIALWAHNAHIQRGDLVELVGAHRVPTMGALLHERLGRRYVPVSFAFGRGSFRANNVLGGESREFTVAAAPAYTLDGALARAGHALAAFPFANAPADGAAAGWLADRPGARCVGGATTDKLADLSFVRADPRMSADIVVFVAETTAARPSISAEPVGDTRPEPRHLPANPEANLDFSDVGENGCPRGWLLRAPAGGASLRVAGDCLTLSRSGSEDGSASLVRQVAVEGDGDRRVSVRAELASEAGAWPGGAHLTLRYESQATVAEQLSQPPFVLAPTFPVRDGEWHEVQVVLEVPASVRAAEFGLSLVGSGRASLRSLSIDRSWR